MQISSRFTMAVHVLNCIVVLDGAMSMNSETIAQSVGANPVIIRNLFRQLKRAGLITAQRGNNGGVALAKKPEDITLLDIYRAVDSVEKDTLFHFHENPSPLCPVGRNIHGVLDGRLDEIQDAMEEKMAAMKLSGVVSDTRTLIQSQSNQASVE